MLTPYGLPANKIEKVMLLSMWANTLAGELAVEHPDSHKKLIFAGLGKPTYPINKLSLSEDMVNSRLGSSCRSILLNTSFGG